MPNQISPKKLLHSKWTKTIVQNKERHFVVSKVVYDEENNVVQCLIKAVISKSEYEINWRDLRCQEHWQFGWK